MPTTIANTLPVITHTISKIAIFVDAFTGWGGLLSNLAAYRISNTPRMVGKMVIGVQKMPMTVASAVPEAASPQIILTMPLARVVHAMTFTKVGFCCMIFLLILVRAAARIIELFVPSRWSPLRYWFISLSYTPYQETSCKSIRRSRRFDIFQIQLQRFA